MVNEESTNKGVKIILTRNGKSCIKDSANSECLHDYVDTEDVLSEDEYKGFRVQTKLTSEGHMEVTYVEWIKLILLVNIHQYML